MHPNEDLINGYVEDTLGPAERAEVDRHLESCADCRQLAADLTEIRRAAGSLEMREPPARAWLRLERAIQLESRYTVFNRGSHATTTSSTESAASADAAANAQVVEAELRAAESHYDRAIKGL